MSYHRRPRPACERCGKRVPRHPADWNCTRTSGVIVGYLCPSCQTPEENAEAEINSATTDYSTDANGFLRGNPRGAA